MKRLTKVKSRASVILLLSFLACLLWAGRGFAGTNQKILVPAGDYVSPFAADNKVRINSFYMDKFPATVPNSQIARTQLSWFEAAGDCQAKGGRLPTTDEWEYVAAMGMDEAKIIERYSRPALKEFKVGLARPNRLGIHDLYGLVWEWTEDFNSGSLVASNDRFFCGGGAVKVKDPKQYSAFMRFAYRSSIKPTYAARNLGYRCVYDISGADKSKFIAADSPYKIDASWTNSAGLKIKTAELAGKVRVIAMVYTQCKTVCPMVTAYMRRLEEQLPEKLKAKTRFTLISFDTESDGPEELTNFRRQHKLGKRWDVLVGERSSTRQFAQFLEVAYKKQIDGSFEHSGIISILDESGKILAQLPPAQLDFDQIKKLL